MPGEPTMIELPELDEGQEYSTTRTRAISALCTIVEPSQPQQPRRDGSARLNNRCNRYCGLRETGRVAKWQHPLERRGAD